MEENTPIKSETKSKAKLYVFAMLGFAFLTVLGFGFYKYNQFQEMQYLATQALFDDVAQNQQIEQYKDLKQNLMTEKERCKELLLQEEGNFSEFTYCQRQVEFFETLDL